jgi:hypothetical protein
MFNIAHDLDNKYQRCIAARTKFEFGAFNRETFNWDKTFNRDNPELYFSDFPIIRDEMRRK